MLMDVVFWDMAWVERRLSGDEFAVCSLITAPSADSFVDVLQQRSSFTTDHDDTIRAKMITEMRGADFIVFELMGIHNIRNLTRV